MNSDAFLAGLPGIDLIRDGIADLEAGRVTVPACLAAIAAPRLKQVGLRPAALPMSGDVELRLYHLLRAQGDDAYSRYNALLRELVSFEQALDHRFTRLLHPA